MAELNPDGVPVVYMDLKRVETGERGVQMWVGNPFNSPHEKRGLINQVGVTSCGGKNVRLTAISVPKFSREGVGSGDSLVVLSAWNKKGTLVMAHENDGFTPIDLDAWKRVSGKSMIPVMSPDIFFSALVDKFINSERFLVWAKSVAKTLSVLPGEIKKTVRGHANLDLEGILKYLIRDYLTSFNDFRTDALGGMLDTEKGREIANGIFAVAVMWLPHELGNLPEASEVRSVGHVAGAAINRSLADTVNMVQLGRKKVEGVADANRYVDDLFVSAKDLMRPEDYQSWRRERLYKKVNRVYSAPDFGGIDFALSEEEQLSGVLRAGDSVRIWGSTDGGLDPNRNHGKVNFGERLRRNGEMLKEDPNRLVKETQLGVNDDALLYRLDLD